jgi:hypothetical protein
MKPQARTDIKTMLKNADDVEVPMDPAYYHKLHDKIMMKIDDQTQEDKSIIVPMKRLKQQRELLKKY